MNSKSRLQMRKSKRSGNGNSNKSSNKTKTMKTQKKQKKQYITSKYHECSALAKEKDSRSRCIKSKVCHINKCNREWLDYENAQLNESDLAPCAKYENDFDQFMKCKDTIKIKKGLDSKTGKFNQCIATKCPEDYNFHREWLVKANAEWPEKCEPCKSLSAKLGELAIENFDTENECKKKYDTETDQNNCSKSIKEKISKINHDIFNCHKKCSSG